MGLTGAKMSKQQNKFLNGNFVPTNVKLKHVFKTDQDMTAMEYNMNHTHRGIAIIFNHREFKDSSLKHRDTEKDVMALKESLELLGFKPENIFIKNDLTKYEIVRYSYKVSARNSQILEDCDCIAVFILTHGSIGTTKIYAHDDDYDIYELVGHYTPSVFKELAGKPKLFFINASRDYKSNDDVQTDGHLNKDFQDNEENDQSIILHPFHADILISMSSHLEHTSICDQNGSWYIQDLCNSIKYFNSVNQLDTVDLTDILMYAHYLVSQRKTDDTLLKQTPNYTSALCRKVYFTRKHCN